MPTTSQNNVVKQDSHTFAALNLQNSESMAILGAILHLWELPKAISYQEQRICRAVADCHRHSTRQQAERRMAIADIALAWNVY